MWKHLKERGFVRFCVKRGRFSIRRQVWGKSGNGGLDSKRNRKASVRTSFEPVRNIRAQTHPPYDSDRIRIALEKQKIHAPPEVSYALDPNPGSGGNGGLDSRRNRKASVRTSVEPVRNIRAQTHPPYDSDRIRIALEKQKIHVPPEVSYALDPNPGSGGNGGLDSRRNRKASVRTSVEPVRNIRAQTHPRFHPRYPSRISFTLSASSRMENGFWMNPLQPWSRILEAWPSML